jgi:hypothetical protein
VVVVVGGGVAAAPGPAAFPCQLGVELVQVETGQPADVFVPDDVTLTWAARRRTFRSDWEPATRLPVAKVLAEGVITRRVAVGHRSR